MSSTSDAFLCKRRRKETAVDLTVSEKHLSELSKALDCLCSTEFTDAIKLIPLKIRNSNAASSSGGVPFSKAYCELENDSSGFLIGNIFHRGLEIGVDFLEGKNPESKQELLALEKLVNFISAGEKVEVSLEELSDSELTMLLVNHLFGKLAISPCYVINHACKSKGKGDKCTCEDRDCRINGTFGDTSIGNGEVWHGSVDVILENNLIIDSLKNVPDCGSRKLPVIVKESSLSRNSQIIAETIVFSFIQKQRHPERDNFLIPCVGIENSSILIMFYDSEEDVLLESSNIPLFNTDVPEKFSAEAIIASWLVINYRFLCTGLTGDMLSYKANFLETAKDRTEIYEKKLSVMNVATTLSDSVMLPDRWAHHPFLLEKHKEIEKFREKNATKYFR